MKIYISLDAEGCSGLTGFEQVDPNHSQYEQCRAAMVRDVKAVIEGAKAGGATHLVVCDAHENGRNLPCDFCVTGVDVVRGTNSPYSMMQGIDNSFDGAFFVGYHAKKGANGIMAHTYFPDCVQEVRVISKALGTKSVGEFGINALVAMYHGVTPLLVTGDDAVCSEAQNLFSVEGAIVKQAYSSGCALCFSDASARLQEGAKRALGKAKRIAKRDQPIIEIEFHSAGQATAALTIPDSIPMSDKCVAFSYGDYLKNFKAALTAMRLAQGQY